MFQRVRPHRQAGILVGLLTCLSLVGSACMNTGADTGDVGEGAARAGTRATVEEVPEIAKTVPKAIRDRGKLTVVMSTSSPPAHFQGNKGMEGADVDLALLLGEVLGLQTQVIGAPLEQILPGLQAERYDAVVSQFSPTADRAKVLDFVNYAQSGTALGVPAGNPKNLAPDQLCGQRVGVQKGSSQSLEIVPDLSKKCQAAGEPALKMSTFPESTAALLGLQSDRVDAVLLDSPVLGYAIEQSEGKVEMAGTIENSPVAIGTVKGSGLEKSIQAVLRYLDEEGLLQKTFDQWGMTESTIHDFAINQIQPE